MAAAMLSAATPHMEVSAIVRLAQVVDMKSRFTSSPKCTLLRFVLQKSITTSVRSYLDDVVSQARASNPPPMLHRTTSTTLDAPVQRTVSVEDQAEWDESDISTADAAMSDWQTAPALTPAFTPATPMQQDNQQQEQEGLSELPATPVPVATFAQPLPSFFVPAGAPMPTLPANATLAAPVLVGDKVCLVTLPHGSQLPAAPAQQMFSWINSTGRKPQVAGRRKSGGSRSRSPSPTHCEPFPSLQTGPVLVAVHA
jgi:hypothetical protein